MLQTQPYSSDTYLSVILFFGLNKGVLFIEQISHMGTYLLTINKQYNSILLIKENIDCIFHFIFYIHSQDLKVHCWFKNIKYTTFLCF